MKSILFVVLVAFFANIIGGEALAQNIRIVVNGTPYYDNDALYVPCNSDFTLTCQVLQNGSWGNTETDAVFNLPLGWSVVYNTTPNGVVQLSATVTTNQNGGSFRVRPVFYSTITINGNTASRLSFSATPPLNGSYQ